MARIKFNEKQSAAYRSLSIHQKINVRSGFDVATAYESGENCRYIHSIQIQSTKIGNVVYGIDNFYISPRRGLNRYGCTE